MRIVTDITLSGETYLPASNIFIIEMMMEMARKHTNNSFIFLAHQPQNEFNEVPANVTFHYINRYFSKWPGKGWWHNLLLPKKLARLQADLFVTVDNLSIKKTGIPVCLFLVHGNVILQPPAPGKNNRFLKLLNNAIGRADTMITFSENDREGIQKQFPASSKKVRLLRIHMVNHTPLKWTEKEIIKIEFAGGFEYFVFAGDGQDRYDLIGLLKAFSLFKKWQQSNMQLLLVGNKTLFTGEFSKKLASFKYRNDVRVLVDLPKESARRIIAASYAFVYPALFDHFPINILLAMQTGTPVISFSITVCKEWGGEAVMYPETNDAAGFAKSMQQLFKDEKLRSAFIEEAGRKIANIIEYDTEETCMNIFEESISK